MKFNEWYPNGKMVADGAISITKVRNVLKKIGIADVIGKNIRVNGQLRGCSGFATCPNGKGNGRIVYFNTEISISCYPTDLNGKILYRYAKSTQDYCGELNRYCSFENLGREIKAMFGLLNNS